MMGEEKCLKLKMFLLESFSIRLLMLLSPHSINTLFDLILNDDNFFFFCMLLSLIKRN